MYDIVLYVLHELSEKFHVILMMISHSEWIDLMGGGNEKKKGEANSTGNGKHITDGGKFARKDFFFHHGHRMSLLFLPSYPVLSILSFMRLSPPGLPSPCKPARASLSLV